MMALLFLLFASTLLFTIYVESEYGIKKFIKLQMKKSHTIELTVPLSPSRYTTDIIKESVIEVIMDLTPHIIFGRRTKAEMISSYIVPMTGDYRISKSHEFYTIKFKTKLGYKKLQKYNEKINDPIYGLSHFHLFKECGLGIKRYSRIDKIDSII